jgi:arsenate reductase (thioredoxin)
VAKPDERPLIYFLCVGNAMRSQMAEAFLRHHAADRFRVASAGTNPAGAVFPEVIAVMREKGIRLDGARSKPIAADLIQEAERIIDLGGRAAAIIPAALAHKLEEWDVADPYGSPTKTLRGTRDEIERRVRALVEAMASPETHSSEA